MFPGNQGELWEINSGLYREPTFRGEFGHYKQNCGLVVRVSALRLGGRGFKPHRESRPGHTKDYKNGTQCLPA